jgi:polysaccharide biosynthesis/export protein
MICKKYLRTFGYYGHAVEGRFQMFRAFFSAPMAGGAIRLFAFALCTLILSACSSDGVPLPPTGTVMGDANAEYLIGPDDRLQIFVWRNTELSTNVPVRPDGKISIPLVEDIQAAGKNPTMLARDIEKSLKKFVDNPIVTVMVTSFVGPFSQQVRVVGQASQPRAVPYREHLSVLDVMIQVGGLTQFAAGNRASLIRVENGQQVTHNLRLDDLLKDGDITANADLLPGDVIIIPLSFF